MPVINFDTTRMLDRPPRVAITDKSGTAGILMWIRDHSPDLAPGLTRQDPRVRRLNETVIEEFSAGRVTSLGDDAFRVPALQSGHEQEPG